MTKIKIAIAACFLSLLTVQSGFSAGFMKKNFCVFNSDGEKLDTKDFKKAIKSAQVVYVGETHDQMNDHLAQLETLKLLYKSRKKKIVVGFEMLNMKLQPILNEYASREIDEKEFLERVVWKKEWGFDFNFYKPIFDFLRKKKLKALALNVPKKIVSKIARKGISGLSENERELLPPKVNLPEDEEYLSYLKKSFSGHGAPMARMFKWENYLASMSAWNEAMGANLAAFLKENPDYAAFVVAGNGHVIFNQGIPRSVKLRISGIKNLSIYTEEAGTCPEKPEKEVLKYADLIWFVNHPQKREKAGKKR